VRSVFSRPAFQTAFILQREKERRAAEEKRIQEGSRLRKQREQLTAELNEVKAQLIKRQSLEEMKTLIASFNVNAPQPIRD
jgi:cell shape-determining protein MreC